MDRPPPYDTAHERMLNIAKEVELFSNHYVSALTASERDQLFNIRSKLRAIGYAIAERQGPLSQKESQ